MSLPNDPSTRVPWGYAREKCVSYELCRPGYTLVCQHSPLPQSHPPFPATSQLCIHSSAEMHLAPPRRALQKTVNLPVRPKIVRRTRTLSLSLSLFRSPYLTPHRKLELAPHFLSSRIFVPRVVPLTRERERRGREGKRLEIRSAISEEVSAGKLVARL